MKTKMKKHLLMWLLVVCTMLTVVLGANAEDSATEATALDSGAIAQQVSDITTYRKEGDFIAPDAPEGYESYIFAGWYTDDACTKALGKDVTSATIGEDKSAYAKFVPEEVLSVRAQIIGGTTYESTSSTIRFVTTVDSLNYESVGFDFVRHDGTKLNGETDEVYKKLWVLDSNGKVMNYTPWNVFHTMSKYFMACNIRNVENKDFGHGITATPYWVTLDGTKVPGVTATKTVNMGYTPSMVGVTATSTYNISTKSHDCGVSCLWGIRCSDTTNYNAQGGCTDGTYYYQALIKGSSTTEDAENDRVYIRKVDMSSGETVAISSDLTLHHANDITYNPDLKYGDRTGLLVVIHNAPVWKRISFVNPDDMTTLIDPSEITDLAGNSMSWAWKESEDGTYLDFSSASYMKNGVFSINYNSTYKKYVVGISGGQTFTFLDANFKESGNVYQPTSKTTNFTTQGNTCDDGYVYFVLHCAKMSSTGADLQYDTHVISVYDWDGNFVTVLQIPTDSIPVSQEVENISIYNNQLYIAAKTSTNVAVYKVSGAQYEETTNVASIVRDDETIYYTSLEAAMMDAEADETITVLVENVEVSSQMEMVNENVTLTNAAGVDVTITRRAAYTGLTLFDNSAPNFTIKSNTTGSLTFDGSGTQAGNSWIANSVDGELHLENITMQNISANQLGGAVRVKSGQVTIKGCTFKNNTNKTEGGAIYSNATLTVENSIFESNSATSGGAICSRNITAVLNVKNCKFGGTSYTDETTGEAVVLGNKASSSGGAIYNGGSGTVIVNGDGSENSIFEDNQASGANGGGAICIGTGTLTLDGYSFVNNTASVQGGAIALRGSSENTITNSIFDGNDAEGVAGNAESGNGGAIHNRGTKPTIRDCEFTGNTALRTGGALYNETTGVVTMNAVGEDLYAKDALFSGNKAGSGGAIAAVAGTVTVNGYTFDGNEAEKKVIDTETTTAEDGTETPTDVYSDAQGGAIYVKSATVGTTDCVFTANESAAHGGAIFNGSSAKTTVTDTTFQQNKAGNDGGAIYNSATLNLVGTKGDEETVTAVFDNNGFIDGAASTRGAAIYNGSTLNATACVFKNHVAAGNGGAICNYGSNPKFTNCQFISNQGAIGGALYSGGGVKIYFNVSPDAPKLTALFEGNIATTRGGAIGVGYGHTYVDGYEFKSNHAPCGGALYLENDKQTKDEEGNTVTVGTDSSITNSKFSGNYTTGTEGGAVFVYAGEVDIEACNFDSNTSNTHAGAIYTKAVTDVTGCTFTSNEATKQGGAIKVEGSTAQLNVTKTTFGGSEETLGNIAETSGGAIYGAGSATITVGTENGAVQATEIFANNRANAEFGGGAICVGSGILRVYGYAFTDNYAAKEGGAIAKRNNAELTVKDALFESNETGAVGGAIRSYATTSTIENTTFTKNKAATRGGAIYTSNLTVDLTGSSFNENSAIYGGAINCQGGTLEATSCHFTGNISTADMTTDDAKETELTGRGGGAVNLTGNATGTFDGTGTFTSNKAENALGGAIYTTDAELSITGYTFSENVAYQAGAILIDNVMEDAEDETLCDTDIEIKDSKFEKNRSTKDGGAIYSIQRKLVLAKTNANAETVFDDNYSAEDGGAIKLENVGGELEVSNYTFTNNEAGGQGGAIECHADKATISSCTFGGEDQGNTAGTSGGAFYAGTSCVTEFKIAETVYTDAKFVENKANVTSDMGGGAICMGSGNLTVNGYTFTKNTSESTGGAIRHNSSTHTMTIMNSVFNGNESKTTEHDGGGAIYNKATLNMSNTSFNENKAASNGGAVTHTGFGKKTVATIHNCKFEKNQSTGKRGGAIYGVWTAVVKLNVLTDGANVEPLFYNNYSKDGGGAICMGSGELQVTGYTFDDNNTTNYGGAVRLNNSAIPASFINSTFSNNDANTQGGAIFSGYTGADAVAFDVTNCKFDTNGSNYGGAIYINTGNQKVTLTGGTNALFINNNATADGGAIYFDKSQNTESSITDYTFSNNSATTQGGAIGLGTTSLTISDSDFTENSSVYGGAINSYKSTLITNDCDFTSNKSLEASTDSLVGRGGGALNIVGNSDATINGGTFKLNSTDQWGGAIYTTDSSLTIEGSVLDGNEAKHAAAILIDGVCEEGDTLNTDTIYVRNTEIKNNIATNSGGAIYVNNRNLTLEKTEDTANAIISGNQSQTAAGGAIYMGSGNLTIKGYTVQSNTAKTTGGAIHHNQAAGRLEIHESVFELNEATGLGGAILNKAELDVDDCQFNQNKSATHGGVISLDGAKVEDNVVIRNSTFEDNKATGGEGSSINVPTGFSLTLENCQFTGGTTKANDTTNSVSGFGDIRVADNTESGKIKIAGEMVVNIYFNQAGKLTVSDSLTEGSAVVANWRIANPKKISSDTFEGINFVSEADMNASKGYITLSDNYNSTYAIKFADDKGILVKATKVTTEEEFNNALTAISESESKIGAIVLGADITISAWTEFPTGCDITVVDDGTPRKFIRSADYTGYMLGVTSGATVTFASTGGDNTNPRIMIDGADVACTGGNTLLENKGTLIVCQGIALQNNQTSGSNQGIALYSQADSNTTFKGAIRNITSTFESGSNPSSVAVKGTVTFDNAVVENNVTNNCGMLRVFDTGSLTANNTEFKNNTAGTHGGVFNIPSGAGTVSFNGCTFTNNKANGGNGGAIYNYGADTNIINCKFDSNTASVNGGAIYSGGSVTLDVTGDGTDNSVFTNNKALGEKTKEYGDSTYYGGGAISIGSGYLNVSGYKFTSNETNSDGGAINNRGTTVTVNNCEFTSNKAVKSNDDDYNGLGGAIFMNAGTLNVDIDQTTVTTFKANHATNGGAIAQNSSGTLNLNNAVFTSNIGDWNGGVLYHKKAVNLTNCDFASNTTVSKGGAVCSEGGTFTATSCDFTGNTSDDEGGAYRLANSGTATITSCTFTGNTASKTGGGAIKFNTGTLTIDGCTFSGNTATKGDAYGHDIKLSTQPTDDNYYQPTIKNSTFNESNVRNSAGTAAAYTDGGGNTLVTEE